MRRPVCLILEEKSYFMREPKKNRLKCRKLNLLQLKSSEKFHKIRIYSTLEYYSVDLCTFIVDFIRFSGKRAWLCDDIDCHTIHSLHYLYIRTFHYQNWSFAILLSYTKKDGSVSTLECEMSKYTIVSGIEKSYFSGKLHAVSVLVVLAKEYDQADNKSLHDTLNSSRQSPWD